MRLPLTLPLLQVAFATLIALPAPAIAQESRPQVELETSEGAIVLELDAEKAPKTVANFLEYVKSGHYEGTIFHRVIPNFMIQGGGMDQTLKEKKTRPPVVNEAGNGLSNKEYTIAMARTRDPHSATCQFFINTTDNPFLDRKNSPDGFGYTVFGRVIKGLDVVDRIEAVETSVKPGPVLPMENVPVEPVTIKKATIRG